jgi:hypothetical protein
MWSSFHHGGCFYVQGGGQALSDAFVRVIESHRGKVLLRTEVTGIQTRAGRVVGVETRKRGPFHAPVVVSNAAAPLTFHSLLDTPDLADADLEKVDALPIAVSIHQAYVGIRGDAAKLGLTDRGSFFMPSYDFEAELRALESGDYRKQGWLLGNHNLADPGHQPPGRSVLHASVMADGRLWEGLDDATYRERGLDLRLRLLPDVPQHPPTGRAHLGARPLSGRRLDLPRSRLHGHDGVRLPHRGAHLRGRRRRQARRRLTRRAREDRFPRGRTSRLAIRASSGVVRHVASGCRMELRPHATVKEENRPPRTAQSRHQQGGVTQGRPS